MKTLGRAAVAQAAAFLDEGRVVILPTDTVYGLAARVDRRRACEQIFTLKGRPSSLALPVLVASRDQAVELVGGLDDVARLLVDRWWPGALTVVVPCSDALAEAVGSKTPTVGLRCPDDDLALAVLRTSGPLCVTSANRHGQSEARSAEEAIEIFGDEPAIAAVLDGGTRHSGTSSIVSVTDGVVNELRAGPISFEEITATLRTS